MDGAELLARPNIQLVTVGPEAIRELSCALAGASVAGATKHTNPFDWILADVPAKHDAFEFVLTETASYRCAKEQLELTERAQRRPLLPGRITVGSASLQSCDVPLNPFDAT